MRMRCHQDWYMIRVIHKAVYHLRRQHLPLAALHRLQSRNRQMENLQQGAFHQTYHNRLQIFSWNLKLMQATVLRCLLLEHHRCLLSALHIACRRTQSFQIHLQCIHSFSRGCSFLLIYSRHLSPNHNQWIYHLELFLCLSDPFLWECLLSVDSHNHLPLKTWCFRNKFGIFNPTWQHTQFHLAPWLSSRHHHICSRWPRRKAVSQTKTLSI